jgi:hypothetical protein
MSSYTTVSYIYETLTRRIIYAQSIFERSDIVNCNGYICVERDTAYSVTN